uniref:(northern house mosquito) hypothetical protein n=1 Tax=Culex pipiens TaxID=7175 RepID=A0A8D8P3B3_CULPI
MFAASDQPQPDRSGLEGSTGSSASFDHSTGAGVYRRISRAKVGGRPRKDAGQTGFRAGRQCPGRDRVVPEPAWFRHRLQSGLLFVRPRNAGRSVLLRGRVQAVLSRQRPLPDESGSTQDPTVRSGPRGPQKPRRIGLNSSRLDQLGLQLRPDRVDSGGKTPPRNHPDQPDEGRQERGRGQRDARVPHPGRSRPVSVLCLAGALHPGWKAGGRNYRSGPAGEAAQPAGQVHGTQLHHHQCLGTERVRDPLPSAAGHEPTDLCQRDVPVRFRGAVS